MDREYIRSPDLEAAYTGPTTNGSSAAQYTNDRMSNTNKVMFDCTEQLSGTQDVHTCFADWLWHCTTK